MGKKLHNSYLEIEEGRSRILYYADVFNSESMLVGRIPITELDLDSINDTNWLNVINSSRDINAEQETPFKNSFPIYPPIKIVDNNIDIILKSLNILIDEGFLTKNDQWISVFGFLKENIDYFKRGIKYNSILKFLEEIEGLENIDKNHFYGFYINFLSNLIVMDIGGRDATENRSIKNYVVERIPEILSGQPIFSMPGVVNSLNNLHDNKKYDVCFDISSEIMLKLSEKEDSSLYRSIKNDKNLTKHFKILLKLMVDCAQRRFVTHAPVAENASVINLKGGVEFFIKNDGTAYDALVSFKKVYDNAKSHFSDKDFRGDWSQIYDYYRLIAASHSSED